MAWMRRLLRLTLVVLAVSISAPSQAETVTLPFTAKAKLSGVEVTFPIAATLTMATPGAPIDIVARADLADLIAKIDGVITAAGLHQPPGRYQSFNYNGTLLQVAGGRLWAKYHFRIDPHDFKPTNGSVEVYLRPVTEANALRLVAEGPNLNVSNDTARVLVQRLGLDRKLTEEGLGEINRFLASPDARLQLPPELASADAALKAARFANVDGRQVLEVEGSLTLTMALLAELMKRVGASN